MNCALALRMLDGYIDDELDAVTAAEMVGHLATCPACAGLHGQRVAMRTALRAASLREVAPPGLRKAIVREIEKSAQPRLQPRTVRWWQALALGASTAVMGALGGWWLAQPRVVGDIPRICGGEARGVAHARGSAHRRGVVRSPRGAPVVSGAARIRPDGAGPVRAGIRPAGREGGSRRRSASGSRRLPAAQPHHQRVLVARVRRRRANRERRRRSAAFNVVTWSDRDMEFAAVSDTDSTELRRFIAAYRAP